MRPWLLVTGGGKRLGRAVALAAASRWNLALHYRADEAAALETAREAGVLGAETRLLHADMTADNAAQLMQDAAALARQPIRGLVNAAAAFEWDDAASFSSAAFRAHMETNALVPSLLIQAFAAALPDDAHGAIVNFLDFRLFSPYPDHLSYTLSKYALLGATEMFARALAPRVRVNAVAPGYALPAPGQSAADFARLSARTPLGRGAAAGEIAAAALFLLENEAVTGVVLPVDAGQRFSPLARDPAFD
ncbi:MAG: SDR family oxidoreductase [Hyphomonadaceae bacterium]